LARLRSRPIWGSVLDSIVAKSFRDSPPPPKPRSDPHERIALLPCPTLRFDPNLDQGTFHVFVNGLVSTCGKSLYASTIPTSEQEMETTMSELEAKSPGRRSTKCGSCDWVAAELELAS